MFGGDSPDYSAPGARARSRSQSSSSRRRDHGRISPRDQRHHGRFCDSYRGKSRSEHLGERGSMKRSRSRSRSPLRYFSGQYNSRSRSKSPSSARDYRQRSKKSEDHYSRDRKSPMRNKKFPWDEEECLRSLSCKYCNIQFNDGDSVKDHLMGTPHLKQLRRLQDDQVRRKTGGWGLNDVLVPKCDNFDPNFWDQDKGPQKLRPAQERFLDTERFDAVPANFDSSNYDYGEYKSNESELFCEPCNVRVRYRHQMQVHKEGANHKKKFAPVQRFYCPLCLVQASSQETLDNHMRGKEHIKRVMERDERRRLQGRGGDDLDGDNSGYRTGPREMARLSNDDFEELEKLRVENTILKRKLEEYINELKRQKQICHEKHIDKTDIGNIGLHVKKQEVNDDLNIPSTSCSPQQSQLSLVKQESDVKHRPVSHGGEYVEQDDNDIIVLSN